VFGTAAVFAPAIAPAPAEAQTQSQAQAAPPVRLPSISVEGEKSAVQDYKVERVQSPKYTEPLVDTPQTITVIPRQVMEEQGVTSVRSALRYVPGVTAMAGEGGGPQGDNLRIRGFQANTDLFVDGVRDIAQYTRDPFNLEAIEVIKGPAR
jgi:catecholate siderophore receptor